MRGAIILIFFTACFWQSYASVAYAEAELKNGKCVSSFDVDLDVGQTLSFDSENGCYQLSCFDSGAGYMISQEGCGRYGIPLGCRIVGSTPGPYPQCCEPIFECDEGGNID